MQPAQEQNLVVNFGEVDWDACATLVDMKGEGPTPIEELRRQLDQGIFDQPVGNLVAELFGEETRPLDLLDRSATRQRGALRRSPRRHAVSPAQLKQASRILRLTSDRLPQIYRRPAARG